MKRRYMMYLIDESRLLIDESGYRIVQSEFRYGRDACSLICVKEGIYVSRDAIVKIEAYPVYTSKMDQNEEV